MKKFLLNLTFTTLLLSVGYSQCNESNWESYYPNLQGCDLQGAYLYGADFWGVDLSGANLSGANLTGANLTYANLCNLTGSAYGECEESSGITDEDGDGYDDVSFDVGYYEGATSVDITSDNYAAYTDGYEAGAASVTPEDGIGPDDVDDAYSVGFDTGYDEGFYDGEETGDVNHSGELTITDIVIIIDNILND